jgi:hypothetical protein
VGGLTFDLSKEWTPQIEHVAETLAKKAGEKQKAEEMATAERRDLGEED